jgi:hypothetical protein
VGHFEFLEIESEVWRRSKAALQQLVSRVPAS